MFKQLTKNQRVALTFAIAAACVLAYVFLFYRPMQARIAQYDTTKLEKRLKSEQRKSKKMADMTENIADDKLANVGTVEPYDNQKNEINALHDILAGTGTYRLEFAEAVRSGNTVRRNFTITYDPDVLTYDAAAKIATDLYHCEYRCLVRTIEIDASTHAGSIGATFIETMDGATTTAGLSNDSDNTTTTNLAESDMSNTVATRQD